MRSTAATIALLASCSSDLAAPPAIDSSGSTDAPISSSSSSDAIDGSGTDSTTSDAPTCSGAWAQPPLVRASSWSAVDPRLSAGRSVALAPDGDVVAAHASWSDPATDADVLLVRYDPELAPRWIDAYAGSGLGDEPLGVVVDALGRPYALARENLSEVHAETWTYVDSRLVLLAYEADGRHRWRWELESEPADPTWPNDQRRGALAIDDDGHLHVLATGDLAVQMDELQLVEFDGFGNVLRHTSGLGAAGFGLRGFALTSDGEARVLTDAYPGVGEQGGMVYAIAKDGSVRDFAAVRGDRPRVESLAIGPSDEVVVVGQGSQTPGFVRAFGADGSPSFAIDTQLPDRIGGVVVACDGTIILVGTNLDRVEVVALDRDGERAWSIGVPTEGAVNSAHALAIAIADDDTSVAVVGTAGLDGAERSSGPWLAVIAPE